MAGVLLFFEMAAVKHRLSGSPFSHLCIHVRLGGSGLWLQLSFAIEHREPVPVDPLPFRGVSAVRILGRGVSMRNDALPFLVFV